MPKRMLITTMKIINGILPVIPVRSDLELPQERIFEAIEVVNKIAATAPIKAGKIIIKIPEEKAEYRYQSRLAHH